MAARRFHRRPDDAEQPLELWIETTPEPRLLSAMEVFRDRVASVRARLKLRRRLRVCPIFRTWSAQHRRLLEALSDAVTVDAGQVLLREGDVSHHVYVVLEGTALVTHDGLPVGSLGSDAYFGEIGVLTHTSREITVTSLTPMWILVLREREFYGLLGEVPRFVMFLLADVMRRLAAADQALTAPLGS